MGLLKSTIRCALRIGILHPDPGGHFHSGIHPGIRLRRKSRDNSGHLRSSRRHTGVTLVIYNYSTPCGPAGSFTGIRQGMDRGLATALSRTKAVGQCSIAGALSL